MIDCGMMEEKTNRAQLEQLGEWFGHLLRQERRGFSGEYQEFCLGLVKWKKPSKHSVEYIEKAVEYVSLEYLSKIWA